MSFGKVAEFQRRGVVHYHVILRLDGLDPADPAAIIAPPEWATVFVLAHALREALRRHPVPHPAAPGPAGRLGHRLGRPRQPAASISGRCGSPATG